MTAYRCTLLLALFVCIHNAQCQHDGGPSTVKGACEIFEGPDRRIVGKTKADQRWIDKTIERGVTACDWLRPPAAERNNG